MANLNCQPATNVTTNSADVHGTADFIDPTHFLRIAYGVTNGGPWNTFTTPANGTNSPGQDYDATITQLLPDTPYYYVLEELDTDGITIIAQSDQCQFKTRNYETRCDVVSFNETQVTVRVCADYVAADQTLDFIYGDTPGGPYPNVGGSVVGTNTKDQCAEFTINLAPCEIIYFRGSVTNVPAIYEVDWAYAHGNRAGIPETVELRLGPEATYPLGQTLVDTDVNTVIGSWNHKSGTFPIPLNVNTLHMGFVATTPPGSVGNFLDSTSIVLRRVLPTPFVIGEQLQNPGFELPVVPPGVNFIGDGPAPPIVWQTNDVCNCIEMWTNGTLGIPADTGNQFIEMNAFNNAELFQVVPLAVLTADSQECVVSTFKLDCNPATVIECNSAIINGDYCGLPSNYSVQFQYSTSLGGPFFNAGYPQFVNGFQETDQPVSLGINSLDPGTQYFYRLVALDPQQHVIGVSETCTFTTDACIIWCGGFHDPADCVLVDPGNGEPYFNCNDGI